ncbi:MAG: DinB family protein [Armatimonadetes bacterium]|nr:DinB family protein [Armatimonadota bacterium]
MAPQHPSVKSFDRAINIFLQDLQALPEEAFTKSFGPATRTVADIVYEVNLVNDDVALVMQGQKASDWPEGWVKAPADFNTKDIVTAAFSASSADALAVASGFSNEELEAPLQTEDGETTRADRCRFMTIHLWYHSGQLNFIQTLLGDDAWHWA